MELKNATESNVQLYFNIERNKNIEVDFVHIPAGATVELDDDKFQAMLKTKTTVSTQRREVTLLDDDTKITMGGKPLEIVEYYQTGETREINLLREMIRNGQFVVVSRPEVSLDDMKTVLNKNGISVKDMADETVAALYDKLA